MEDKNKGLGLKSNKTIVLKDQTEGIMPKDKRKTVSASKLRSRLSQHGPSTPILKEKPLSTIQKQLDKLCLANSDKRNSDGVLQSKPKTRPQSSTKIRKSVFYKPLNKNIEEIVELPKIQICPYCQTC